MNKKVDNIEQFTEKNPWLTDKGGPHNLQLKK